MLEQIISIIAPHTCFDCHKEGSPWCASCRKQYRMSHVACYHCKSVSSSYICHSCARKTPLTSMTVATLYGGVPKELVHALKFNRMRTAADSMALALLPYLPRDNKHILVHVPTATSRMRLRGYDQAELIAKHLSLHSALPHWSALDRTGQRRQVGASASERHTQLQGSFRVKDGYSVSGKSILLVDDVLTTGSTAEECARTLLRQGASQVHAVVFAIA